MEEEKMQELMLLMTKEMPRKEKRTVKNRVSNKRRKKNQKVII